MTSTVLDGECTIDINDVVGECTLSETAIGTVEIEQDGDCYLTVTENAEVDTTIEQDGECGIFIETQSGEYPHYTGAVTVTPSRVTQVLQTAETVLLENITINPIPSNYGLITWNGAVLTVS